MAQTIFDKTTLFSTVNRTCLQKCYFQSCIFFSIGKQTVLDNIYLKSACNVSSVKLKGSKALFTGREGNAGARVTPTLAHFFFFTRRVYKAGRVTLARGLAYLPLNSLLGITRLRGTTFLRHA